MKLTYLVAVNGATHKVAVEAEEADLKAGAWNKMTISKADIPGVLAEVRRKLEADRATILGAPIAEEPKESCFADCREHPLVYGGTIGCGSFAGLSTIGIGTSLVFGPCSPMIDIMATNIGVCGTIAAMATPAAITTGIAVGAGGILGAYAGTYCELKREDLKKNKTDDQKIAAILTQPTSTTKVTNEYGSYFGAEQLKG